MLKLNGSTTNGVIDQEQIAVGVRLILEAIGEDPEREGLRDTAKRVAKMYAEFFHGLYENPRDHLAVSSTSSTTKWFWSRMCLSTRCANIISCRFTARPTWPTFRAVKWWA